MSKEEIFLAVAADLAKFYAVMGHALRFVGEDPAQDQMMTLEQVKTQFHRLWETLLVRLESNPVMKNKVENDYKLTLKLLGDYRDSLSNRPRNEKIKQEANQLQSYARERTASLSDLVAIFRSL